jgi:hypothetical protein
VSEINADLAVRSFAQKIRLRFSEIYDFHKGISRRLRGALRPIVTKRGSRDAMDEEVSSAQSFCADERHFSDGQVVWS